MNIGLIDLFFSSDSFINYLNARNNYLNRKVNEEILEQQMQGNEHLKEMKMQLAIANETSSRILETSSRMLEIQIQELERYEEQKYYKALSFHIFENIKEFKKVDDKVVLCYLMDNYYQKFKKDLLICNDILDEISDKLFNKDTIEKLEELNNIDNLFWDEYQKSVLLRINIQFEEFNKKVKDFLSKEKSIFNEKKIKDKSKNNPLRIIGVAFFGFLTYISVDDIVLQLLAGNVDKNNFIYELVTLIFFGVSFYLLLKSDIKWRKNYELYKKEQEQKRKLIEEKHNNLIEERKKLLLEDPFYESMQIIQKNHPSFELVFKNLNRLEANFYPK